MLRVAGYETLEQLELDSMQTIASKLVPSNGRTVRHAMLEIKDILIPEYVVVVDHHHETLTHQTEQMLRVSGCNLVTDTLTAIKLKLWAIYGKDTHRVMRELRTN